MENDRSYFVNTLNSMGIEGIKRRYWLKIFNKNPDKAGGMFFEKLDREFQGNKSWAIAKFLLLKKYPHWAKPEPQPQPQPKPIIKNLAYYLQINGGRWGDAMFDVDEHNKIYGVDSKEHIY